jgi:Na+/H+-dicarboxylate symporter
MKKFIALAPIAALFTACEDAGNPGNDNLLTGGSLVLIVIVVVVVVLLVRRRR